MLVSFNQKRQPLGFTLIELLVVIAVIGLLASIVLVSLQGARAKARDARRMSDLRQLATALELYYHDKGGYAPDISCHDTSFGWGCDNPPGSPEPDWHPTTGLRRLELDGYIGTIPYDPINNATYFYSYEPHCSVGGKRQGHYLRTRLESTGQFFYIKVGVQYNDPNCHLYCDNTAPPCY